MRKRRASKQLTWALTAELAALGSPMEYGKAFGCCQAVEQHDGELTSYYCRCRWCVICNRIRMAQRIDRYAPIFEEWGEVYFVTLTVPNVRADALSETLDRMQHQLKLCRLQLRRTRGLDVRTVRATEVTFNGERADFHPHYHVAVYGAAQARALVEEWLKRWPEASRRAQDVREWDGEPGSLKELTKYCTKLVAGEDGDDRPPAWALDQIFRALKGRHLFRPCGFELPPEWDPDDPDDFEELRANVPAFKRPGENILWWWTGGNWVDRETGELLVNDPPDGPPTGTARTRAGPRARAGPVA